MRGHDLLLRVSDEGDDPRRRTVRWAVLIGAIVTISLCHYRTPPEYAHWHVVYQRLYYLPILFGTFWYGLRGGLGTAVITAILYSPHIVMQWKHEPLYRANQFAEILMFFVIGSVAGILIDRIRREQEEHRRTAQELARAYEQLQRTFERLRLVDRLRSLGELSAGMAHEIKNPLGSIMGAVEILESAVPENDERREFVGILQKELQRLSKIVSSHLDLVRPVKPRRARQDVGTIVNSVIELARKEASQRDVNLDLDLAPGLPEALVDGSQVRQAVLNLVINAIQALKSGGKVEVAVLRRDDRICMTVEDDGPGLGEESLQRAFEPFYTTKEGGTGLGLSIAFQIADWHGGDLFVENRSEGGARFVLELPIEPVAQEGGLDMLTAEVEE